MLSLAQVIRRPLSLFPLIAMLTLLWVACSPWAQAQSADRVLGTINPNARITVPGHPPSWASSQNDTGAMPADIALDHLTLILARSPEMQQAFEQFLASQQDPGSADYHQWLTPIEIGERFGVSLHDIAAVSDWLRSQGLHVDSTSSSRDRITFSGSASAVGNAFGAEMHYFKVNGKQHISITSEPRIPAALAPVIKAIHGLYTIEHHPAHKSTVGYFSGDGAAPALNGSGGSHFIAPADFATIYDLNSVYNGGIKGTGQTIAIVGEARVYNPDIENFQSLSGLATKDPTVTVPPNGVDPGPPASSGNAPGVQGEATLDVARSGSIAPDATILLVVSALAGGGIDTATEYVVDTTPVPAHIMSISFIGCEANGGPAGVAFWDALFSQGAAEGISTFVASGDAGAAECDPFFQTPPASQVLTPNYICSSSYATCVGGTEFADTANPSQYWSSIQGAGLQSALSYIPEGGWNEPMNGSSTQAAASGGGVSAFIPTPSWQIGTGVPAARAGRYTPDVAFSSSGHDGYFACLAAGGGSCVVQSNNFSFSAFSGTSAAAPDMAGIAALLNQKEGGPQGNLNPTLYKLAATVSNVFHDVTVPTSGVSGCSVSTPSMCNNSTPSPTALTGGLAGYLVGAGYDEVTGLGSLDVANLLASWNTVGSLPSVTSTNLTSNSNPAFSTSSVTFTATVLTSGSSTPTGAVTFLDGATSLGTGTLNASGVATLTTATLVVGSHSITAVYPGDANNTGSTSAVLTETIQTGAAVPVLSSLSPFSATAGGSAFVLTVFGFNFTGTSVVLWNGSSRPTSITGNTILQASITANDIATVGVASVAVMNSAGDISNSQTFDILETFSGSGGFLSMFQNGGVLGNSALYQSNGLIGLNTTTPQAALDVNITTSTAAAALNTNVAYANTSPINGVATSMNLNFLDKSQATTLSKQTARIIYQRDASATGGVSAFDTIFTMGSFLFANAPYQLRGLSVEGPVIVPGKTLGNFTGLLISAPSGGGTVSSTNAILTAPNSGNVGLGTLSPATALQVAGDIRVGTSASNGCLQNFSGAGLVGTCTSDARLKTNILPFAPVLDKLMRLQPVHFDWKMSQYPEYRFGAGRNAGLLAQDVEGVFPEMVTTDERGFKMVNYSELPYLTLAAIRELKIENDSLRAQLAQRQRELEELRQQVDAVGARLAKVEKRQSHRSTKQARAAGKSRKQAAVKTP